MIAPAVGSMVGIALELGWELNVGSVEGAELTLGRALGILLGTRDGIKLMLGASV